MSDTDTPDETATFAKGGGKGSSGGKGGKGSSGAGKLSGGHWATIHGHPIYVKDGKVVAGGVPGLTHDRATGKPHGTAKPAAHQPIPVKGKPGKHVDKTPARDVERERDEAKSRQDYRKAGAAHAKAKADHAAARKALADHDKVVKNGPGELNALEAHHESVKAKLAGLKAKLAEHEAAHAAKPAGRSPVPPPVPHEQLAAHRTVKSSAPRDARESAVHAHASARGKSAMVVTATPTYHASRAAGQSAYHVGGRQVATHHVDEKGRHVVTTHHRDGTTTTIKHNTKESAKRHLEAYVKHRIARGTTRHAVVGDHGTLSSFDHRKHGIGSAHHRVTGRVLGDGGHVNFDDEVVMGVYGDLVTFRGGGVKPAKASGKASGKAAAKSGHSPSSKPGGCGTGAGGFQAGNTCGHKGNRNQKVEAARAAHTAAKHDVLKHVKAHRAASKAAAKAGEAAPAPKDLHAAIRKAAAAHRDLKAARDTHRAEQRDKRNVKAKERRAVKAGRAEPLSARPKAPSLREQADKHRAGKGGHDDRARDVWRKAMERNSVASKERSREVERTLAGQKLKPKYERERQEKIDRLSRQQDRATRAARKAGNQIGKGNNPPTPPHTGLTSSQARPSATTPPTRNDRLAVLAARHEIAGKRLATLRDESARHAYTGQVLSGKGNVNPESPTQRGRYAESHAIGRRAQIHKETAERLRESIHDPAKSGAAARTLKSLSKNPVGGRANESAIRATAGKLTHSELKAAATGAGLDHGGSRNRYELRDHLLRTVGKAKEIEKSPEHIATDKATSAVHELIEPQYHSQYGVGHDASNIHPSIALSHRHQKIASYIQDMKAESMRLRTPSGQVRLGKEAETARVEKSIVDHQDKLRRSEEVLNKHGILHNKAPDSIYDPPRTLNQLRAAQARNRGEGTGPHKPSKKRLII